MKKLRGTILLHCCSKNSWPQQTFSPGTKLSHATKVKVALKKVDVLRKRNLHLSAVVKQHTDAIDKRTSTYRSSGDVIPSTNEYTPVKQTEPQLSERSRWPILSSRKPKSTCQYNLQFLVYPTGKKIIRIIYGALTRFLVRWEDTIIFRL